MFNANYLASNGYRLQHSKNDQIQMVLVMTNFREAKFILIKISFDQKNTNLLLLLFHGGFTHFNPTVDNLFPELCTESVEKNVVKCSR